MQPFRFTAGDSPLLVSMPHVGTHVPGDIAARMTEEARALPDNDWHVDRLYDFVAELGASTLAATHPRYVVDLNRPPDDDALYPGQDVPGLVPLDTFSKQPIYRDGEEPDETEVQGRVATYWQPYHDKLRATLDELRARHGHALLWEAHSIRSFVPRFVDAPIPHLNIGTGGGRSCNGERAEAVVTAAQNQTSYSWVVDGRFRGGYTTRHYGQPGDGIHAIQLELSQVTYMDEDPSQRFREDLAAEVRPVLRALLTAFAMM